MTLNYRVAAASLLSTAALIAAPTTASAQPGYGPVESVEVTGQLVTLQAAHKASPIFWTVGPVYQPEADDLFVGGAAVAPIKPNQFSFAARRAGQYQAGYTYATQYRDHRYPTATSVGVQMFVSLQADRTPEVVSRQLGFRSGSSELSTYSWNRLHADELLTQAASEIVIESCAPTGNYKLQQRRLASLSSQLKASAAQLGEVPPIREEFSSCRSPRTPQTVKVRYVMGVVATVEFSPVQLSGESACLPGNPRPCPEPLK